MVRVVVAVVLLFFCGRSWALSGPVVDRRPVSSAKANLVRVLDDELVGGSTTADVDGTRRITRCVEALEDGMVEFPRDLKRIDGTWRLLFTTNAPRPLPRAMADVVPSFGSSSVAYQSIDTATRTVNNSVVVTAPVQKSLGETLVKRIPIVGNTLAQSSVRFDLRHTFLLDDQQPNRLRITLREITRNVGSPPNNIPGPLRALLFDETTLAVPFADLTTLLPSDLDSGSFDTTYCDDTIRLSRGPRGNLRVFLRCDAIPPFREFSYK